MLSHDWLQVVCYLTAAYFELVSRACSIDYYFSPPQKRLMSPENSTRKVNTILKCQEINDIVLSCYGSAGEGDKCLALFTPFLPICDLFPCPSDRLCLLVYFSFSPHLPSFFPPSQPPSLLLFVSFPLLTMESRRQGPIPRKARKCCSYMQQRNT